MSDVPARRASPTVFSGCHFYAAPERDPPFNICCLWFRRCVVPGSVDVEVTVDSQTEVASDSFPVTSGGCTTVDQAAQLDRFKREIVVSFDDYSVLRLGNDFAVPI